MLQLRWFWNRIDETVSQIRPGSCRTSPPLPEFFIICRAAKGGSQLTTADERTASSTFVDLILLSPGAHVGRIKVLVTGPTRLKRTECKPTWTQPCCIGPNNPIFELCCASSHCVFPHPKVARVQGDVGLIDLSVHRHFFLRRAERVSHTVAPAAGGSAHCSSRHLQSFPHQLPTRLSAYRSGLETPTLPSRATTKTKYSSYSNYPPGPHAISDAKVNPSFCAIQSAIAQVSHDQFARERSGAFRGLGMHE